MSNFFKKREKDLRPSTDNIGNTKTRNIIKNEKKLKRGGGRWRTRQTIPSGGAAKKDVRSKRMVIVGGGINRKMGCTINSLKGFPLAQDKKSLFSFSRLRWRGAPVGKIKKKLSRSKMRSIAGNC